MRKVIQLTTDRDALYALCNDGTMFYTLQVCEDLTTKPDWKAIGNVPQSEGEVVPIAEAKKAKPKKEPVAAVPNGTHAAPPVEQPGESGEKPIADQLAKVIRDYVEPL